jgi:hypothetical protein
MFPKFEILETFWEEIKNLKWFFETIRIVEFSNFLSPSWLSFLSKHSWIWKINLEGILEKLSWNFSQKVSLFSGKWIIWVEKLETTTIFSQFLCSCFWLWKCTKTTLLCCKFSRHYFFYKLEQLSHKFSVLFSFMQQFLYVKSWMDFFFNFPGKQKRIS